MKYTEEQSKAILRAYRMILERGKEMVAAGVLPPLGERVLTEKQQAFVDEVMAEWERQKREASDAD